ncbi:hypothetical protein P7C71_g5628, partial [Lecanoromycetidae sp. Uapishka_2]
MHKSLLCATASYFQAAFEGNFIEAKTHVLELPDEDSEVFKQFQLWAYTSQILSEGETCEDVTYELLAKLYFFGDMCGIPALQNAAMDLIFDKQDIGRVAIQIIPLVYEKTVEGAPLRRLLVEYSARCGNLDAWFTGDEKEDFDFFTKEFLADLVVAAYKDRQRMLSGLPQEEWKAFRKSLHIPTTSNS